MFTAFASGRSAVPGVLKDVDVSMKMNETPDIQGFGIPAAFLCLCALAPAQQASAGGAIKLTAVFIDLRVTKKLADAQRFSR